MQKNIFYHIYPFGLLGTPMKNGFKKTPVEQLKKLVPWLEHLSSLGCTALYLGPVFESTSHGYDTADYFQVDRRLGTNESLQKLVSKAHDLDIKVILDAVFNHVGRDFYAFKDLQKKGKRSKYKNWFSNVDFSKKGKKGDGFSYDGWHGHYQLVELNLQHSAVKKYLFAAVADWIEQYQIDGLRIDAADVIDKEFLAALRTFCKAKNSNFWLLGEVVFGDYNEWANEHMLDSVTNYEYHTPLNESFNYKDFGKIARVLKRQYGDYGLYKHIALYSFVDNHDVDRAASALNEPVHLYPLYLLLFTMPGIPSIYYGSEWGFKGKVRNGKHYELRPKVNLKKVASLAKHPDLIASIKKFTAMRRSNLCLTEGFYRELLVEKEQFAFVREIASESVICVINASRQTVTLEIQLPNYLNRTYTDILDMEYQVTPYDGVLRLEIPSCWGRVLSPTN